MSFDLKHNWHGRGGLISTIKADLGMKVNHGFNVLPTLMEVVECDPGLKGNTVSGGTKPATLETGATIRVPLFINIGDKLKIDNRNKEYVSRAKEDE